MCLSTGWPSAVGAGVFLIGQIWPTWAAKLLVREQETNPEVLRDRVFDAVDELATPTWSVNGLIENAATGVDKARALATVCNQLVADRDVVAFGDMPNDIPDVDAGTSYAMTNARSTVLDLADHVAPACEKDGLARPQRPASAPMITGTPASPAVIDALSWPQMNRRIRSCWGCR